MSKNLRNYIKEISSLDQLTVYNDNDRSFDDMVNMVDKLCNGVNEPNAVLFNGNSGFSFIFNTLGSTSRIKNAFEIDSFKEIIEIITTTVNSFTKSKSSIIDRLNLIKSANRINNSSTILKRRDSQCQEIIKYKIDLEKISFLKYHKDNNLIIKALVNSTGDHKKTVNCEMLPLKVLSKDSFAIISDNNNQCSNNLLNSSQYRIPIAVTFGGNPIYTALSMSYIPENIGIYSLSGFLLNKKVGVTNALTQNISIASDYDLVLEGYIQKSDEMYRDPESGNQYPIIHISCITSKKEGIIMVNSPKSEIIEQKYVNMVAEKFLLFSLKNLHNINLIDLHLFEEENYKYAIFKLPTSRSEDIERISKRVYYSGYLSDYQIFIFTTEDVTIRNRRDIVNLLDKIEKDNIYEFRESENRAITIYNATK